jgi:uncharacterized membrane protein YkvA (DUF1232 family)
MKTFFKLKTKLLTSIYTLYLIFKHPQTPWQNKIFIVMIIVYFLSPLDLIPDLYPLLGQIDDLIVAFCGTQLSFKMAPTHILVECRQKAKIGLKKFAVILMSIILIWIIGIYFFLNFFLKLLNN